MRDLIDECQSVVIAGENLEAAEQNLKTDAGIWRASLTNYEERKCQFLAAVEALMAAVRIMGENSISRAKQLADDGAAIPLCELKANGLYWQICIMESCAKLCRLIGLAHARPE